MHRIKIDIPKNRIRITLSGFFNLKTAGETVIELEKNVRKLEPNFDIICDVCSFKPTNIYVLKKIAEAKKMFDKYGARYAVFAVGSSRYALTMFAKFTNFKNEELLFFVPSLEEAEAKMAKLTKIS